MLPRLLTRVIVSFFARIRVIHGKAAANCRECSARLNSWRKQLSITDVDDGRLRYNGSKATALTSSWARLAQGGGIGCLLDSGLVDIQRIWAGFGSISLGVYWGMARQ